MVTHIVSYWISYFYLRMNSILYTFMNLSGAFFQSDCTAFRLHIFISHYWNKMGCKCKSAKKYSNVIYAYHLASHIMQFWILFCFDKCKSQIQGIILYFTSGKPQGLYHSFWIYTNHQQGWGAMQYMQSKHSKITLIRLKMRLKYGVFKRDYIY